MAYGRKTGGRDFKKGNDYGKISSRKLTKEQKEAKKRLALIDGKLLIAHYSLMNEEGLVDTIQNSDTPALEKGLAQLMLRIAKKGALGEVSWVMERLFDFINADGPQKLPTPIIKIGNFDD